MRWAKTLKSLGGYWSEGGEPLGTLAAKGAEPTM